MTTGTSLFNSRYSFLAIIALIFVMIGLVKGYIYSQFSILYTDDDQCIMWVAAEELRHGHFREPCFFGQEYNSCLEGWLAVPFLWLGMEHCAAVPLCTLLMSVIPFLLLTWYFIREKQYLTAAGILFTLAGFSLEYHFVSVLPRGFITGVFLFGIAYFLLLKKVRYHYFWFSFFSGFAIILNETSLFLLFPVLADRLMNEWRNKGLYLQGALGLAAPIAYKAYIHYFYHVLHPDYVYFEKEKFSWKWSNLTEAFQLLDQWLFRDFSFILATFLALMVLLFLARERKKAFLLLTSYLLTFLMFGFSRLTEGTDSVMISKSRYMIFIPFLLAVFVSLAVPGSAWRKEVQLGGTVFLFLYLLVHCGMQLGELDHRIRKEVGREDKIVSFLSVQSVYEQSYKYIALCSKNNIGVLIFDGNTQKDAILNTTIPILSGNKVRTLFPFFDRRTWSMKELVKTRPKKIAVLRNWAERYYRPALAQMKRRHLALGDDHLVEYEVEGELGTVLWEKFGMKLRLKEDLR